MTYPRVSLDDAVVAVTGGARGIGRATADLFTARGATVCTGDLDGGDYTLDVTSRDSFASFAGAVVDRFGRIDVLVNNAGVMPLGDFLSEDDAISATTMDVNVWGLIHGMRAVMPHMVERGSGHVVNVASKRASWSFLAWRSTTPASSPPLACRPRSGRSTGIRA